MAEWSIAAVLKTVDCNRSGGSNPSSSASSTEHQRPRLGRFFYGPTRPTEGLKERWGFFSSFVKGYHGEMPLRKLVHGRTLNPQTLEPMKTLISLLFVSLFTVAHAQMVYTKDGVPLGDGPMLVKICQESADASMKGKELVLNGIALDTRAYCECAMLNLIPSLESSVIIEANASGKMMELLMERENFQILIDCVSENATIDSTAVNFGRILRGVDEEMGDQAQEYFMQSCLQGVRQEDPTGEFITDQMARDYCECAIDALLESDTYSFADVLQAEDPNSAVFEAIVVPCASEVFGVSSEDIEAAAQINGMEESVQAVKKRGASKVKKR